MLYLKKMYEKIIKVFTLCITLLRFEWSKKDGFAVALSCSSIKDFFSPASKAPVGPATRIGFLALRCGMLPLWHPSMSNEHK